MQTIFITGGTGYIGSRLIDALRKRGDFQIKALTRQGSAQRLQGCEQIMGNALEATTYKEFVGNASIFVHLVGVPHPSPAKKKLFKAIDLVSVQEAAHAAHHAGIDHFIYLSVAQHPTEIMKEYQEVRAIGEKILLETGMKCSFVRPWYVLGPGHWWPLLLKPLYLLARLIPRIREQAQKLDTVTIRQMIHTLIYAIDHPPVSGYSVYEVRDIRKM